MRWRGKRIISLLVAAGGVALALARPASVVAAGPEALCVPPLAASSGDFKKPDGWLAVEFINRAIIKVDFTGTSGNCTNRDLQLRNITANRLWQAVMGGNYVDTNAGDDNFDYRRASGDSSDDSRIDHFSGGINDDPFGGNDRILTIDQIRALIPEIELTLGIEEDLLGEDATCPDTNSNFVFTDFDNDGKSYHWICNGSSDIGPNRGLRIRDSFRGLLENFNITYNFRPGDPPKIQHASEAERDTRTFIWCPTLNSGQGEFRTENCNGPLYIRATPAELQGVPPATPRRFVMRKDGTSTTFEVLVAGADSPSATTTTQADQDEGGTGGDDEDESAQGDEECAVEAGAFAWILCPIVRLADAGFSKLLDKSKELLEIDFFIKSESTKGLESIWGVMRTLANVSFVLVFLAIIFANTLSLKLDSYTIKRMLPRLVAATVLVQFSFIFSRIVLDIANVLGKGIEALIEAAITSAVPDAFSVGGNPSSLEQFGGALLLFIIGGAFIAVVGLPFLLLLILSAFIGIMGVFITLLLRQLVIALLVVISPLAFVAWVLPNTEAFFRFWWKNFFKTVMMYPLIVLIISLGSVLAAIVNLGADNTPAQFAAAFFPVIAWFMIPATFKMVGGITGAVAGKVTGTAGKVAGKTSSFARKRYAPDMKGRLQTLAAGGGVKFAGKNWLGGGKEDGRRPFGGKVSRGLGRGLGMAGTLSGATRSQANFNSAEKASAKELEQLGLDGVEASELIVGGEAAMSRAVADHAAGKITDADLARKKATWKNVQRYHGSKSHMAAAAKSIGQAGIASEDTRADLIRSFGSTGTMGTIGEQIWRDAAFNSKDTRGHLRYIDYASGEVDAGKLADDAAGRGEAWLAKQNADSWAHILKASQLTGKGPSAATISALTTPGGNNSVSDAARAVITSPTEVDNRTTARPTANGGPVVFV